MFGNAHVINMTGFTFGFHYFVHKIFMATKILEKDVFG